MKLDEDRARVIILCLFVIRLMVWLFCWSMLITWRKQEMISWEFSLLFHTWRKS